MEDQITSIGEFQKILVDRSSEMQAISNELRNLLIEIMPTLTEVVWENQKIAGYGIGPKKMSEHFAYIDPHKNHVNLGFMYGADLDDPEQLLEGTGKKLRHIKIRSLSQVSDPEIRKLLVQASKHFPKL